MSTPVAVSVPSSQPSRGIGYRHHRAWAVATGRSECETAERGLPLLNVVEVVLKHNRELKAERFWWHLGTVLSPTASPRRIHAISERWLIGRSLRNPLAAACAAQRPFLTLPGAQPIIGTK